MVTHNGFLHGLENTIQDLRGETDFRPSEKWAGKLENSVAPPAGVMFI